MIPEKKLETMAAGFLRAHKGSGSLEEDLLAFGKLVQQEMVRLHALELRRAECLANGGHLFISRGEAGFGEIQFEGDEARIQFKGSAPCATCDAYVVIQYKEQ